MYHLVTTHDWQYNECPHNPQTFKCRCADLFITFMAVIARAPRATVVTPTQPKPSFRHQNGGDMTGGSVRF